MIVEIKMTRNHCGHTCGAIYRFAIEEIEGFGPGVGAFYALAHEQMWEDTVREMEFHNRMQQANKDWHAKAKGTGGTRQSPARTE